MTAAFSPVLPHGMDISPRLMARLTIPEVGSIEVAQDGSWRIADAADVTLDEGSDNHVPYATGYGDLVENVLSFMAAVADYGVDSEELSFPRPVRVWAVANQYALEDAKLDFEDRG